MRSGTIASICQIRVKRITLNKIIAKFNIKTSLFFEEKELPGKMSGVK